MARQGYKESRWQPNAVSPGGGYGLAQFTGATGAAYLGGSGWQQRALDPQQAIDAQARLMRDLLKTEHGNYWTAARDYNGSGPAAISYANALVPGGHGGGSGGFVGAQPVNLTIQKVVVEVALPDGSKRQVPGKVRFDRVAGIHTRPTRQYHGAVAHPANRADIKR